LSYQRNVPVGAEETILREQAAGVKPRSQGGYEDRNRTVSSINSAVPR